MLRILLFMIVASRTYFILCENAIYSKFHQSDYEIKDFRVEVDDFNDKYVNHLHLATYKYNRSTTSSRGSVNFKVDNLQDITQSVIQFYKFASNEYRLFPIRYQTDFCAALNNNAIGLKKILRQCGNITECKFKKETTYYFCNFVVDGSKMPPLMPTGMYKVKCSIMCDQELAYSFNTFLEVYRKFRGEGANTSNAN